MSLFFSWRGKSFCKSCVILLVEFPSGRQLIHHAARAFEAETRKFVSRFNCQRLLEELAGSIDMAFGEIHASEIVVREVARFVAFCFYGLFEPRDGFFMAVQVDQVKADIVVRITEVRIDFDGALAFCDGFFNFSLKMICPAKEGVGLGCWVQSDGS